MRKERSKVEGTGRRQEAARRWNSLEKPSSRLATQALCHPPAPEQAELCQRLPGISQSRRKPNRGASGSWNPPAFHTPTRSCEQTVPTQGGAGRVSCFTQMHVSFPGSRAWRRCICLIVTEAPYAPQLESCILQSRLQFHKLKSPTLALPFQKPVIPDLDSHVDHSQWPHSMETCPDLCGVFPLAVPQAVCQVTQLLFLLFLSLKWGRWTRWPWCPFLAITCCGL